MTDEPGQQDVAADDWAMPEPVFRSSEGRKPGELPHDPQGDIPTEPGFIDQSEPPHGGPIVRPKTGERKPRYVKKQRGCLRTFTMLVAIIAISLLAIVVTLVYFLLFYRPPDTTF